MLEDCLQVIESHDRGVGDLIEALLALSMEPTKVGQYLILWRVTEFEGSIWSDASVAGMLGKLRDIREETGSFIALLSSVNALSPAQIATLGRLCQKSPLSGAHFIPKFLWSLHKRGLVDLWDAFERNI